MQGCPPGVRRLGIGCLHHGADTLCVVAEVSPSIGVRPYEREGKERTLGRLRAKM